MTMTDPKSDDLDDLFAQMRDIPVVPSDALMARVLADAAAAQPRAVPALTRQHGLWGRMMEAIGGWPSFGGLAVATVAGIWVGVAPPSSFQDITATLIGEQVSLELVPTGLALGAEEFVDG